MDRDLIKMLVEAIRKSDARKTSAYDTTAVVKRVENGVAWVHIPGGVDETPVRLTVDAKAGDTVQVRVSGGRAFITGNATAPPTDNTLARTVQGGLNVTRRALASVKKTAEGAMRIAGNTHQYFWFTETGTDTGAHITEKPQEQFLADPQNGGGNLLARSNGIAVRDGLTELASFSASGITFGDEDGERVHMEMQSEYYEIGANDGVYLRSSGIEDAGSQNLAGQKSALDAYFRRGTATRESSVIAETADDPTSSTHAESVTLEVGSNESGTPKIGQVKLTEYNGSTSLKVTVDEMLVGNVAPIVKDTFSATNLSASTYYLSRTFNITKSGYTPIAVNVRTNQAAIYCASVDYSTPASTGVTVGERSASSISGLNLYLDVTYARSELL